MNKKIGILTYFWAHNPGTFLQAYSMLREVKEKFPDYRVELIDCRMRKVNFKICKYHVNIICLMEDYRHHRTYCEFQDRYLQKGPGGLITYDYETLTEYIGSQNYAMILVGADTVLEVLPKHFKLGQLPIYWLPPTVKCKKVAFSASAGALTYDMLGDRYRTAMSESINAFDLVGVRDDNAYNLVKALGLKDESKLEITPDPTFSFKIDYCHINHLLQEKHITFNKPTVAINLPESLSLCRKLVDNYQDKGFSVLLLGYSVKHRGCRFPKMSPFEWAGVHKYFALEITDRFHGCIFSLKNSTPVVAVDYEERKRTAEGLSKTHSLLKLFDLHDTNHINTEKVKNFDRIVQITDDALRNFNPELITQKIKQLQNKYHVFMNKVAHLLN